MAETFKMYQYVLDGGLTLTLLYPEEKNKDYKEKFEAVYREGDLFIVPPDAKANISLEGAGGKGFNILDIETSSIVAEIKHNKNEKPNFKKLKELANKP